MKSVALTALQTTQVFGEKIVAEYDGAMKHPLRQASASSTTATSSDENHVLEARQSRKPKPASRLYTFLTRSRSRSTPRELSTKSTLDHAPDPPRSYHSIDLNSPQSKAPSRASSRPLSTTTTATNTTITPQAFSLTPRAEKRRQQAAAVASAMNSPPTSRPPSPSHTSSGTRRRLHNLFGLTLGASRKSSGGSNSSRGDTSRSRPSTPVTAHSIPEHPPQQQQQPTPGSSRSRKDGSSRGRGLLSVQRPTSPLMPQSDSSVHNSSTSSVQRRFRPTRLGPFGTIEQGPSSSTTGSFDQPGSPTSISPPQPPRAAHAFNTPRISHTPASPTRHSRQKESMDSCFSDSEVVRPQKGKERASLDNRSGGRYAKKTPGQPILTREVKHGSFDFERPGWGRINTRGVAPALAMDRSGSGRSGRSRDSDMTPTSTRGALRELRPNLTGGSNSSYEPGGSLGRRGGTHVRFRAGHGPFRFEPAVPASPTSLTSQSSVERTRSRRRRMRDEDDEEDDEFEAYDFEREQIRQARHGMGGLSPLSSAVSVSAPSTKSIGYRSGTKGRSLDLNLGLAWAPTKVRADAVLPGLSRSLSQGRSNGTGPRRRDTDLAEVGKDLSDLYRQALDDDSYALFKKYVHRFDAKDIPFDGPTGIVSRVERLLNRQPHLTDESRKQMLNTLVKIILRNA
ncbi:hypothetical protein K525DRAFT_258779 [Schizophyllum commune Loenen D]|nr:hypothetical protein K525DRAFT_258779 [Schizophyllum commune Loenen D]